MLSVYPSDRAIAALVLGHGAGSGQHSGFMVEAGRQLSARAIVVATFDFPYIAAGRKSPDKAPVLEEAWRAAIAEARADEAFRSLPLFIGGKSMGGRIASHVAAQGVEGVSGLVFLGYPLHPPGRPQQRRDAHLPAIAQPMLFVQGSRDEFGTAGDIRELLPRLNPHAQLFEVADGDHSFKVRVKTTGKKQDAVFTEIFDRVETFIRSVRRP
ncbi:MAG TPA: alpha/beta family hydrolase [Vicinamibacterales bacterium]|nr:alpha/beta family hydrolase [Vicinamibacterales bacterium]